MHPHDDAGQGMVQSMQRWTWLMQPCKVRSASMHPASSKVFICAGLVRKLRRALNEASARAHMFVDQCVKFEKDNIDQVGGEACKAACAHSAASGLVIKSQCAACSPVQLQLVHAGNIVFPPALGTVDISSPFRYLICV
jgi:hypothetical protein